MEPKLSIIVPVYKVEAYLCKCLDSILAQSFTAFELLLVDDGSPDRCGEICDDYARKDGRIRVIHKQNGGLMSAWKAGFAAARCSYTGFVDSDDWVDADMFGRLYEKAEQYAADIVCCDFVYEMKDRSLPDHHALPEGLYDEGAIREQIFPAVLGDKNYERQLTPNRYTKLYRSELIRQNLSYCYDSISYGEDLHLFLAALCDAKRMYVFSGFTPYHYRANPESITGRYNPHYWDDVLRLHRNLCAISAKKNVYDFGPQLGRDLISIAVNTAVLNEFRTPAGARQRMKQIRRVCGAPELKAAFRRNSLRTLPLKCRFLAHLMKRGLTPAIYLTSLLYKKLRG